MTINSLAWYNCQDSDKDKVSAARGRERWRDRIVSQNHFGKLEQVQNEAQHNKHLFNKQKPFPAVCLIFDA